MSGFHLLSNLWLDSKNEWCRETTGRASNINIRLAKHSHLSVREEPQHTTHMEPTLPARPHSAGRRSGRSRNTQTHAEPTLPARPHSAGRRSGRSRNTQTHSEPTLPARPHSAGRRSRRRHNKQTHAGPTLPARPHSAGRRSGRSCNTYACGQSC